MEFVLIIAVLIWIAAIKGSDNWPVYKRWLRDLFR